MVRRSEGLPAAEQPIWLWSLRPGVDLREAIGFRSRLVGLAGRKVVPDPGVALLLPRTRSIHTFGMRFPVDLAWIGKRGQLVRVDRGVPPRRVRSCRLAAAVIELAAADPRVA